MARKFLVGVSNITAFNKATNELLFSSKTMLNTSVDITTANTTINSGQGNAKQYVYFHTPELNITLEESQWNLGMVAANVGSSIITGTDVWTEETVVLSSDSGVVLGTPIVTPDSTSIIYGYATQSDGTSTRITFTGQNFTLTGGGNETVCVRYYENDTAARSVTIPANFVPSNVRLVLETQLASSDSTSVSGSSIIGKISMSIPNFQMSGSQTINMTSDGVSTTPLSGMALASSNVSGCTGSGVYGEIIEIIDSNTWYSDVIALAVQNDPTLITHPGSEQLVVYAIPNTGSAFQISDLSDLTFVSGTPATATVSATGLITSVATGSSLISIEITAKTAIKTTSNVVVS